MLYEKHQLAVQMYTVLENNSVVLPDHCTWRALKRQRDGKFVSESESQGELCLILEDAKVNFWPVISVLLREEALELSEQLRSAVEGSPTDNEVSNDDPKPYEHKHLLAIKKYTPAENGQIMLPDHCTWRVLKYVGAMMHNGLQLGKYNSRPDTPGALCLILADSVNQIWPVMSFLTPSEALQLAEQLQNAAESSRHHPSATKEPILSTQQAAELLNVSPRQVTRLIQNGLLEASTFGNVYVIAQAEVERYQRERRPRGRPSTPCITDKKSIHCEDRAGNQMGLPFSIIRRIRPAECDQFETALDKLVAVVNEKNLDGIDFACKNYLTKKADLLEAIKEAFDDISPLIKSEFMYSGS